MGGLQNLYEGTNRVFNFIPVPLIIITFFLPLRYTPLTTYATVSKGRAEVVDFRLTRVHSDSKLQPSVGPYVKWNSSDKFQRLIKDLSEGQGLEQLVNSTATENSFRYRSYKDRSDFLRGLNLNFPKITSKRR